jgi:hypothetical protein
MTLPGDAALPNSIDPQFKAVEKTAMYRSTWELAAYVRHHIADLADERRACSPISQHVDRLASPMIHARHRLGIGLIKVGHALAGNDAVRGLPTAPGRPATWGPSS